MGIGARNPGTPITETGLDITIATRPGDAPASRKLRQKRARPILLLTTPGQFALLLPDPVLPGFFDQLHTLVVSKRGDLLAVNLARLRHLAPPARVIGLSVTPGKRGRVAAYRIAQTAPGQRGQAQTAPLPCTFCHWRVLIFHPKPASGWLRRFVVYRFIIGPSKKQNSYFGLTKTTCLS